MFHTVPDGVYPRRGRERGERGERGKDERRGEEGRGTRNSKKITVIKLEILCFTWLL